MTRNALSRDVLSEILGAVFALGGFAALMFEMYGGGEIHRTHLWVCVGLIALGCYFVQPRRTRELVGLVAPYIPWAGGMRPADPPPRPDVPPPPSVAAPAVDITAAVVEVAQPQTATPAAAHQFDPGA